MSIASQCRDRLKEIKESGVTKFTCYDLLSKFANKKELSAIHSFISDKVITGEIAPIMDGREPKKVKPVKVPSWITSKVMVRIYEFKSYGVPDKSKRKPVAKRSTKANRSGIEISTTQKVWGDVWPEMFINPHPSNLEPYVYNQG